MSRAATRSPEEALDLVPGRLPAAREQGQGKDQDNWAKACPQGCRRGGQDREAGRPSAAEEQGQGVRANTAHRGEGQGTNRATGRPAAAREQGSGDRSSIACRGKDEGEGQRRDNRNRRVLRGEGQGWDQGDRPEASTCHQREGQERARGRPSAAGGQCEGARANTFPRGEVQGQGRVTGQEVAIRRASAAVYQEVASQEKDHGPGTPPGRFLAVEGRGQCLECADFVPRGKAPSRDGWQERSSGSVALEAARAGWPGRLALRPGRGGEDHHTWFEPCPRSESVGSGRQVAPDGSQDGWDWLLGESNGSNSMGPGPLGADIEERSGPGKDSLSGLLLEGWDGKGEGSALDPARGLVASGSQGAEQEAAGGREILSPDLRVGQAAGAGGEQGQARNPQEVGRGRNGRPRVEGWGGEGLPPGGGRVVQDTREQGRGSDTSPPEENPGWEGLRQGRGCALRSHATGQHIPGEPCPRPGPLGSGRQGAPVAFLDGWDALQGWLDRSAEGPDPRAVSLDEGGLHPEGNRRGPSFEGKVGKGQDPDLGTAPGGAARGTTEGQGGGSKGQKTGGPEKKGAGAASQGARRAPAEDGYSLEKGPSSRVEAGSAGRAAKGQEVAWSPRASRADGVSWDASGFDLEDGSSPRVEAAGIERLDRTAAPDRGGLVANHGSATRAARPAQRGRGAFPLEKGSSSVVGANTAQKAPGGSRGGGWGRHGVGRAGQAEAQDAGGLDVAPCAGSQAPCEMQFGTGKAAREAFVAHCFPLEEDPGSGVLSPSRAFPQGVLPAGLRPSGVFISTGSSLVLRSAMSSGPVILGTGRPCCFSLLSAARVRAIALLPDIGLGLARAALHRRNACRLGSWRRG
jgi:hypothetical protein